MLEDRTKQKAVVKNTHVVTTGKKGCLSLKQPFIFALIPNCNEM